MKYHEMATQHDDIHWAVFSGEPIGILGTSMCKGLCLKLQLRKGVISISVWAALTLLLGTHFCCLACPLSHPAALV